MKKRTVAIVDDHLLFAQSLKGLIDTFEEFNVLYHATNGKDLIEKLETISNKPDIILMDINMPIMNGIETTYWLKKNFPEIKVLVEEIRYHSDKLERLVDDQLWPLTKYRELLFVK